MICITTYNSSQTGQSYDYEYDYAGRLLFAHTMGTTNAAMAYTYDANGNMTVGLAGKQVTYDYNNRPTSVVFGGQTTVYTYGPDGARQTKTVGGVETFYTGMIEIRDFGTAQESIILQPHADFRMRAGRGRRSAICTATT